MSARRSLQSELAQVEVTRDIWCDLDKPEDVTQLAAAVKDGWQLATPARSEARNGREFVVYTLAKEKSDQK